MDKLFYRCNCLQRNNSDSFLLETILRPLQLEKRKTGNRNSILSARSVYAAGADTVAGPDSRVGTTTAISAATLGEFAACQALSCKSATPCNLRNLTE